MVIDPCEDCGTTINVERVPRSLPSDYEEVMSEEEAIKYAAADGTKARCKACIQAGSKLRPMVKLLRRILQEELAALPPGHPYRR